MSEWCTSRSFRFSVSLRNPITVMLSENRTAFVKPLRVLGDTPDDRTDKQTLSVSLKPQNKQPCQHRWRRVVEGSGHESRRYIFAAVSFNL
ncbi:hypothetical protein C8Q74DRAFT_1250007, partial [Fomes fomentarius]